MEKVFDSLGTILYKNGNHKGYLLPWKRVAPLCKKWSRNRDSDMCRVDEMVKYYQIGGYIPNMIHLADLNGEGIVCYDGNHRREVFNKLDDDVICIVDIMFDAHQNDVYKAFNNINKSVQLPAIYLDDMGNSSNVKDEIIQLVKIYETKYKNFLSTSARCHAPNFNRDTFVENIYNVYQKFNGKLDITSIAKLLEKLNDEYSKEKLCRPHSVYKSHIIEKCKKYNFWLFIDRTISFEHIYRISLI